MIPHLSPAHGQRGGRSQLNGLVPSESFTFFGNGLIRRGHTRQHMTAMSPPSLFLAPHIVEPGPSANLAGLPLAGVPGVTHPA